MKKILSLVLCIIMVMAIVPMTVAAEEELVEKELYSNDFSSAEKLEEGTHDDKVAIEDGRLALTGTGNSTNGYWYKEVDVTEAENDTIIFKMRVWIPTKKSSAILYIAGTQVFSSVEQSGESRLSLGNRKIAVSDNGATGSGYLLTVNITKSTGAAKASLEDNGETVISGISFNFGPIGDTLLVQFGKIRWCTRYVDDLYVGTLSSAQQGGEEPVAKYTVTAKVDDTTVDTAEIEEGASYTLPAAQVKDGFEFKGWSDGVNTYEAGAQVAITADTTFTAVFEEIVVEPAPEPECTMRVGGHQTSAVDAEGKYNVRFVGVLSDLPAGSEKVGFKIEAPAFDKEWDLSTSTVYYSLKANFGTETITAEKCGGKYITAAAITDIPEATGKIEFVVTPYVVFMIDGVETKIYGEPETVSDVLPSVAE